MCTAFRRRICVPTDTEWSSSSCTMYTSSGLAISSRRGAHQTPRQTHNARCPSPPPPHPPSALFVRGNTLTCRMPTRRKLISTAVSPVRSSRSGCWAISSSNYPPCRPVCLPACHARARLASSQQHREWSGRKLQHILKYWFLQAPHWKCKFAPIFGTETTKLHTLFLHVQTDLNRLLLRRRWWRRGLWIGTPSDCVEGKPPPRWGREPPENGGIRLNGVSAVRVGRSLLLWVSDYKKCTGRRKRIWLTMGDSYKKELRHSCATYNNRLLQLLILWVSPEGNRWINLTFRLLLSFCLVHYAFRSILATTHTRETFSGEG